MSTPDTAYGKMYGVSILPETTEQWVALVATDPTPENIADANAFIAADKAKGLEEFASKLKTVQITRTGGLFNGDIPVQLPDDKKLQAALHQAIDQALALMV